MKLLFLGDSLTWGGYGGSFVAEVAKRLPDHTIVNAGEGGNTVINLLNRLDSVLEQEPDGVFVMVGGNDAISYSQSETRKYYRRVQKIPDGIVTPEIFAQNYRDLLTRIQLAHVQTWVGLPPVEYNPEVVAAVRQYNELARDAASSLNIPVLDLMAQLMSEIIPQRPPLNQEFINRIGQREKSGWSDFEAEQQRGGFTFTFDGLHLTPEAARRIGQLVTEFLAQHIPELT
jgi:lysophospholipase L1-like esterase